MTQEQIHASFMAAAITGQLATLANGNAAKTFQEIAERECEGSNNQTLAILARNIADAAIAQFLKRWGDRTDY